MRYTHIEVHFIHSDDLSPVPQHIDHVTFHVLNLKLYMSGVLFRFVSPKITSDVLVQLRPSSYRLQPRQSPEQYHSR
jgi:hypothetical protein